MHFNQLTSLQHLPQLANVTELIISANEIDSLEAVWTGAAFTVALPMLRSLDLSANRLISLKGMPFLPRLRVLSLAFNALTSLEGIENCLNLEALDIRGNLLDIEECIDSITLLSNLRRLWIFDGPRASIVLSHGGEASDVVAVEGGSTGVTSSGTTSKLRSASAAAEEVVHRLFSTCLLLRTINDRDAAQWRRDLGLNSAVAATSQRPSEPMPTRGQREHDRGEGADHSTCIIVL